MVWLLPTDALLHREDVLSGSDSTPVSLANSAAAVIVVTAADGRSQHAYTVHLRRASSPSPSPPASEEGPVLAWMDKAAKHPAFIALAAAVGGFVAVACVGSVAVRARARARVQSLQTFNWRKSRGSDHLGDSWKAQPFYSASVGPFMGSDDLGPSAPAIPPPLPPSQIGRSAADARVPQHAAIGDGPNPFAEDSGAAFDAWGARSSITDRRGEDISRWIGEEAGGVFGGGGGEWGGPSGSATAVGGGVEGGTKDGWKGAGMQQPVSRHRDSGGLGFSG